MGQPLAPGLAAEGPRLEQGREMNTIPLEAGRAENPAGSFSVPPQSSQREMPVRFVLSTCAFAEKKTSRQPQKPAPPSSYSTGTSDSLLLI